MLGFALDHVVTIVLVIAAFFAGGILMPQSLRDKFSGVSPDLRSAINARLAAVQKDVDDASTKALSAAVKAISPPMPTPTTIAPPPTTNVLPQATPGVVLT